MKPQPQSISVEKRYLQEMIAHARDAAPNECCGVLAGSNSTVLRLYRTPNGEASPLRYSIPAKELFSILRDIDDKGWELLGIYHSHVKSEAYPSATDVRLAFWPDSLYFIVSLLYDEPVIRAFRITDGETSEVEVIEVAQQP